MKQSGTQSASKIQELEKQLKAAEQKQIANKTLNAQLQEAYAKNTADRVATDKEMEMLRNFMIANYDEAKFHEFEANGGVMPVAESDAQIVVKKGQEQTARKQSNKKKLKLLLMKLKQAKLSVNGGKFGADKKTSTIVDASDSDFQLNDFAEALNNLDYKSAGKIAMTKAKEQADPEAMSKIATEMIEMSLAKDSAPTIKWVSVGLISGANAELKECTSKAIYAATEGTVYADMIKLLIEAK